MEVNRKIAELPPTEIKFDKKRGAFVFTRTGIAAKGLHRILRRSFYPHWHPRSALYGRRRKEKSTTKGWKRKSKGMKRGKMTDNDILSGCVIMKKHGLTIDALLYTEPKKLVKEAKKEVLLLRRRMDIPAKNIFKRLHEKKLHPIGSQVCVGSHSWRVATAVDIICISTKPGASPTRLVPIEVKTGCPQYWLHTGNKLPSPFSEWTDCCWSQWGLQLLATSALMRASFTDKGFHFDPTQDEAYVMRAHANGVDEMPLNKEIARHLDSMCNTLATAV